MIEIEGTTSPQIDFLRKKAKESLYFFAKGILKYDWIVPHIHGPVCAGLENTDTNRKMFVLPRGWLKTTLCSIAFPMWLSINDPDIRVLIVQNSHANACKKLAVIRGQWEQNELLRSLFPELLPGKQSRWTADVLTLNRSSAYAEGTYEAAGTQTKVTSRHYDVIIQDDTVAPDLDELGDESLAPTHDDVQKAIGWHRTNALPLLNNPSKNLILIVGTRWYDQDLIQYVLDNEKHYEVVTRASREDSDGNPDPKGEITYPERFNDQVLQELEAGLGPYMYSCLYMNSPIRRDKMAFKLEWFKYYEVNPASQYLAVYTTIDPATDPALCKTKNTDYSVVMTCGKDILTGNVYVLDYFRQRCNPGELAAAIFDHVVRYRPIKVGYEDVAFQKSIDYWLKELMRQENKFFILERLELSNRKDAKDLRIAGLQPLFASGTIYLRPWMKELVSELVKFPLGAHDDISDALSMQMSMWRMTKMMKKIRDYQNDAGLDFENALESIRARRHKNHSGPIFDPSRTLSEGPLVFGGRKF